jgi:(p)ppGpp synthase/HD superfamily hydrolase
MTIHGYSDRINHALAFAAKHHDQRVRRGTRLPYFTQPANVGIILTRYGCDDTTVIAGILHDVVQDCVQEGYTRDMLDQRVGDKFSAEILRTALAATQRRANDAGVELTLGERRNDMLARLEEASESARWVRAADTLHNAATLLADLQRTVDPQSVWSRTALGREQTVRWYRSVHDRLREVGFDAPITEELGEVCSALEAWPD